METWIFGAILTLIGLLVMGCGLGRIELGLPFVASGFVCSGAGSYIFVTRFKTWIDSL